MMDLAAKREPDLEAAVDTAMAGYDAQVASRGIAVESNEQAAFSVAEQRALIEGLIRVWVLRQLKPFAEEFEVLETEREDLFLLCENCHIGKLYWMSRADGLERQRETDDLYVHSFKTAATFDGKKENENHHDMQGLSEAAAIEARLGKQVFGVKMEFLIKGMREKNDDGVYIQKSPLIRGYRQRGIIPSDDQYAWSLFWQCSQPHSMRKSKWYPDGMCPGDGRNHKRGDGWDSFNVWEAMGVKEWIRMLDSGEVAPEAGDCLEKQLILPIPYFRDPEQIEDWKEQVTAQESAVALHSILVQQATNEQQRRKLLNAHFRQHTRSCYRPYACPYLDVCFGSPTMKRDPIGSGVYCWRTPHHEPELVQLQEKAA